MMTQEELRQKLQASGRTAFDVMQSLLEFAYGDIEEDIDNMSIEEIEDELRAHGIDPEEMVRNVRQRVDLFLEWHKRGLL